MEFDSNNNGLEDAFRPLVMRALGVGDTCPRCGREMSAKVAATWRAGRRVHCPGCDWTGHWRSGTVLSRSTLSCTQFYLLCRYLLDLSENNRAIAAKLEISAETVRNWRKWYSDQKQKTI